jgi:hypothetical protein
MDDLPPRHKLPPEIVRAFNPSFERPRPPDWETRWHRKLTDQEQRDLQSLMRQLSFAIDDVLRIAEGRRRCMAICGPQGVGKTFLVERTLVGAGCAYRLVTGRMTARDMYIELLRDPDAVFVLDDCEDALTSAPAVALLRAACELTKRRILHWRTNAAPKVRPDGTGLTDDELERYRRDDGEMPATIQVRDFEFRGRIIVVTNNDLQIEAKKDRERSKRTGIAALVDRLHPIELGHRDRHIALLRLEQLCAEEALGYQRGLDFEAEGEVLAAFRANSGKFDTITVRTFIGASDLRREYPDDWLERLPRFYARS